MTLLSAGGVSKSFGERTLFSGVGFNIEEGDKIGFIGSNGIGKTTLFKLITGELIPDSGGFARKSGLKIGCLEQHACRDSYSTCFDETLSIFYSLLQIEKQLNDVNTALKTAPTDHLLERQSALQDQFLKSGGLTFRSKTRSALMGLGFKEEELSLPVSALSGGQKSKIGLCKLLLSEPELILLDEPTNHLDVESVEWLEDFLLASPAAVVIISHDRYFLDKLTTRTFELKNCGLVCNKGNYSRHREIEAERNLTLQREYQNKTREIKRIEGIIAKQRTFSMERNYRTIDHKQKYIDRIMETLKKPESEEPSVNFNFEVRQNSGNDVLKAENIGVSFGDTPLFSGVNLDIKKGQRIFLLGANGIGKTTLLKELLKNPDVRFGSGVTAGYFDQMQADLDENSTLFDIIRQAHPSLSDTTIRNGLAAFKFFGDEVFQQIKILSGGERARVALCRLMLSGDNLLLLDEPTNHLDIPSREVLEQALENFKGTLVCVSHDRYFINKLATDIAYLQPDGLINFHGDYNYFLSKRVKKEELPRQEHKMGVGGTNYHNRKKAQAEVRRLRAKANKIEQDILNCEQEIAKVEQDLNDPQVSGDYKKAMELAETLEILNTKLESLMQEWDKTTQELERSEQSV